MSNHTTPTDAGRQYAAAHAAHYATKDLYEALALYRGVMAAHPKTQEAEYSRTQIDNSVKSVVPIIEPGDGIGRVSRELPSARLV